jgi:two-component system KDP operon response regulator KdpE
MMTNNKYKILFVEDEANICTFVSALLDANGYQSIVAKNLNEAKLVYFSHIPDLVILDLGLPDGDGSEFLRAVRQKDATPIIVLSARSDEAEKVRLLDMGANDYVTKPFGSAELLARVRTSLRSFRHSAGEGKLPGGKFLLDELEINYDARRIFLGGEEIKLTQTEYNILALLSEHSGKMMTYAAIIKEVWREFPDEGNIKRLQVNMANIRKKLKLRPGDNKYIINELGVGYRLQDGN